MAVGGRARERSRRPGFADDVTLTLEGSPASPKADALLICWVNLRRQFV